MAEQKRRGEHTKKERKKGMRRQAEKEVKIQRRRGRVKYDEPKEKQLSKRREKEK